MEQKTDRIYPPSPVENKNVDLEQRIEKKLNDVNIFNISNENIKEMTTYFKDKNYKSKKKIKKHNMSTTFLKSFDTIVNSATTSSSITVSIPGNELTVIPKSAATACGLTSNNMVKYEIVLQKYNKYKKQIQKDQQTIKCFGKLYRKSLPDNVFDKNE